LQVLAKVWHWSGHYRDEPTLHEQAERPIIVPLPAPPGIFYIE
jgi:hypothetical protein